ncbi:subtype B tannase [Paenibacillus pinistramenti]|uniref:subtype B tannase n=1 Tax=Paenibacillus pinistramenti TaxID=1768003 RepID=UPI001109818C|nr:subtype B tannase [Paenibacillus pinistramenti]
MKTNKWAASLLAASLMSMPLAGAVSAAASTETTTYSLDFDTANYTEKSVTYNGQTIKYRAYEKVVYVQHPVDTKYEIMNIYIPEEYFEGGTINNYTAENAPIYFPNTVAGYLPGEPGSPGAGMGGGENAVVALSKGYVVAEPGARGRTTQDEDGTYTGKAPADIVDLKAAVRYLRYNDEVMPGDAEKIISDGTSAGGAMSALLGATGNSADYEPYLEELGAADERDDVYAAAVYTPITDLENADMAYEWQFNGVNTVTPRSFGLAAGQGGPTGGQAADGQTTEQAADAQATDVQAADAEAAAGQTADGQSADGQLPAGQLPEGAMAGGLGGLMDGGQAQSTPTPLTDDQIKVSNDLSAMFPSYLNGLGLTAPDGTALTLNADGSGTFKDYIKSFVVASAQKALDSGTDLSDKTWITIKDGKVTDIDYDQYIQYLTRMKTPPAFDGLDLSNGENQLFGTETVDAQHFTQYSLENDTAGGTMADAQIIKMMNPLNYIDADGASTSQYWRIRIGTKDSDTSLAVSTILATTLQNKGYNVDFSMPWDIPHSGDYDLDELFAWADQVVAAGSTDSQTSGSTSTSAVSANPAVKVNDKDTAAAAYTLNGEVYVKLRDLAMAVSGTDRQFEVTWDAAEKAVKLVSGKAYTPKGGELSGALAASASKQAALSNAKLYLDGQEVQLSAYTIAGNNYVKLSDAAALLNLEVQVDSGSNTVAISTSGS